MHVHHSRLRRYGPICRKRASAWKR
ncbi:hypothetical protein [Terriglobus roseus]